MDVAVRVSCTGVETRTVHASPEGLLFFIASFFLISSALLSTSQWDTPFRSLVVATRSGTGRELRQFLKGP